MRTPAHARPRGLLDDEVEGLAIRGYFVRDKFLPADEAVAAHSFAQSRITALKPAGFGRQAFFDPNIRGDSTAFLDESPLHLAFGALMNALNDSLHLGLKNFQMQLGYYPGHGAKYVRHIDAIPGKTSRRISALLYLNPGWEPAHGGQLRLHLDPHLDVEPALNRLVVFSSERVEHEVLPSFAPRLAVTAWYRTQETVAANR